VTQAAVARFNPAGGSIINIGSVVGKMAAPNGSVYSATKGAVDSITVALSKELGPKKIRVNALNPGLVETEGTRSISIIGSEFESVVTSATPLGRIGQPHDIATAAVFLASGDSAWINGQTIYAAGGYTQ
jgi:3-oxoacyl-[acyl-carrier protein] reductase